MRRSLFAGFLYFYTGERMSPARGETPERGAVRVRVSGVWALLKKKGGRRPRLTIKTED